MLHFKFSPQQHPLGLSRVELKETRNFSVWSNEEVRDSDHRCCEWHTHRVIQHTVSNRYPWLLVLTR